MCLARFRAMRALLWSGSTRKTPHCGVLLAQNDTGSRRLTRGKSKQKAIPGGMAFLRLRNLCPCFATACLAEGEVLRFVSALCPGYPHGAEILQDKAHRRGRPTAYLAYVEVGLEEQRSIAEFMPALRFGVPRGAEIVRDEAEGSGGGEGVQSVRRSPGTDRQRSK